LLWWGESEDPAGTVQLFVGNVDGSDVRQVTHDPDGALRGAWSPDGTAIVYVGTWTVGEGDMNEGVTIFVLDLRTGATTPVIEDRAGGLQEPHFSPDGRSILFTRDGSSLWSVSVSGGSSSPLLEGFAYAEFSRDGLTIAFPRFVNIPLAGGHGGMGGQEIWVANADGTDARPLAWGGENPWGGETGHWSPDGRRVAYNFGPVYVTDVTTEATMMITNRSVYVYGWLDDDTLIIGRW
jgi:Tol biopolymer transport system component